VSLAFNISKAIKRVINAVNTGRHAINSSSANRPAPGKVSTGRSTLSSNKPSTGRPPTGGTSSGRIVPGSSRPIGGSKLPVGGTPTASTGASGGITPVGSGRSSAARRGRKGSSAFGVVGAQVNQQPTYQNDIEQSPFSRDEKDPKPVSFQNRVQPELYAEDWVLRLKVPPEAIWAKYNPDEEDTLKTFGFTGTDRSGRRFRAFYQGEDEPIATATIVGGSVNVRSEPGIGSDSIKTVRGGSSVEVLGSQYDDDGNAWVNVRLDDGTEGWIRSDLLQDVHVAELDERKDNPFEDQILRSSVVLDLGGGASINLGVLTTRGLVTHDHYDVRNAPYNSERALEYIQRYRTVEIRGPLGVIPIDTDSLSLVPGTSPGAMILTWPSYEDDVAAIGGVVVELATADVLSKPGTELMNVFYPGSSPESPSHEELAVADSIYSGQAYWQSGFGVLNFISVISKDVNPFIPTVDPADAGDSGGGYFVIIDGKPQLIGVNFGSAGELTELDQAIFTSIIPYSDVRVCVLGGDTTDPLIAGVTTLESCDF
jgi:hypothetical protein